MTGYKQIKDLQVGETVSQVFLIADIEGRLTQKGKPYARLVLKDKSGQISANVWDFDPKDCPEFRRGVYVSLTLEIQDYQGSKSGVSRAIPMPVVAPTDLSLYDNDKSLSVEDVEVYWKYLMSVKDKVKDSYIKAYLDVLFVHNPDLVKLYKTAPASTTNRGAYRGGLVEHVSKVMRNALAIIESQRTAKRPAPINDDIVIAGVLAHDLGKAYAYVVDETGAKMTRSGQLLEHLPMSYGLSVQAFIQAESLLHKAIPEELKDHINHCILAHHGQLDYGSPVKPRSIEAQIIHVADMSDSTSSCFAENVFDNLDAVDTDGFVQGSRFTNKTLYIGKP